MDAQTRMPGELIAADYWIVSSLLQKAIRRGDVEIAGRAARTLHRQKGRACLRRLVTIAFEDVGLGDLGALSQAVSAFGSPAANEEDAAGNLATVLASAPKDRSTDFLVSAVRRHPSFFAERASIVGLPSAALLHAVADASLGVQRRFARALHYCGLLDEDARPERRARWLEVLAAISNSPDVAAMAARALTAAPNPIVLALPLLIGSAGQPSELKDANIGFAIANGIPLYALDKHTRSGRRAIGAFIRENAVVRQTLTKAVRAGSIQSLGLMAAYYVDAAPIARRLVWSGARELERMGLEADMYYAGGRIEAVDDVLAAFAAHLDHLNEVRARVLAERPTP